jgi:hypothetical protein
MNTIFDILPIQDHYYLLNNGDRYAIYGKEPLSGLLVFANREQSEEFRMNYGIGLPEFITVKVSAEEFLEQAAKFGGFCISQGLTANVYLLIPPSNEEMSI